MNAFSSLTHTPQPQLALDRIDVLRQLEAFVSQWPSDLQQSFLQIAKYLTGIVVSPVGGLPLAGGHPHLRKWECIIPTTPSRFDIIAASRYACPADGAQHQEAAHVTSVSDGRRRVCNTHL